MKPDIETKADIRAVVDSFYDNIKQDDLLGPHFQGVDLAAHLPRMYAFWSSVVFQTGTYSGRPFRKHAALDDLRPEHFERWLERFRTVVDNRYEGENAEKMKQKAQQIGWIFQSKLCDSPETITHTQTN